MTHTNLPYISPEPFDSEIAQIRDILSQLDWNAERAKRVHDKTLSLITDIRATKLSTGEIENFLQHYPLSSPEGRALMTLAEALLRIPDADTADALIAEKIAVSDWKKIGGSGFFGVVSSLGLGLAKSMLGGMLSGVAKPAIRKATIETVRRLGAQFVVGETIHSALKLSEKERASGYRMSFDMLGEGARTEEDASRYFKTYVDAAHAIGYANHSNLPLPQRHGMSVKLSALHPRYTWTQADECVPDIAQKLLELVMIAKEKGMTLTVDAEESERLEISLDIFTRVATHPDIKGYNGLGLAVQAYDRRAPSAIDYIVDLARATGQKFQMRLVKGAYWDGEIKRAQMSGWAQYAVYTRKSHTDLSYLYCAQKMLAARDVLYPMFATHNAGTASAILDLAGENRKGYEFQRLYGMGKHLGDLLRHQENVTVTYYAPVGSYEDLLPYLVRRMLENGANTSFVSQIRDEHTPPQKLSRDVVEMVKNNLEKPLPLPLPRGIFGVRQNSKGYDLSRQTDYKKLLSQIISSPLRGEGQGGGDINSIFVTAQKSFPEWNKTPIEIRADILKKTADLLEDNTGHLIHLLQTEGKKTVFDAVAEIREAVDFCRYYAAEAKKLFTADGQVLDGYTGEKNIFKLTGRGVFVAISPWNFPLAIFMGQVVAALVAGNTVIAKPAEQTPKIAAFAVDLLMKAGCPKSVLHLIQGDGQIGAQIVAHPDVSGVVFTGSTAVARSINRTLAAKDSAIVPLIAETGGLNAMIVDSTALPEQVVDDVLLSAFGSAGQRCSALRVLYLQNDIADKVISLLKGAMPLLKVGRVDDISTDIPPVIDAEALANLKLHQAYLNSFATLIAVAKLPEKNDDTYFAPCAYEIESLLRLKEEVFGPILHIIRFDNLDKVIDDINETGYGLTFGLQSRLLKHHNKVASAVRAGNIYINRNMIGAVVGVQPFGGQGLSGTGPKAGGPHYLHRFATEMTVTDNIMATGGNIDLLSSLEE
jgi:RHH-type proline utilization regulon transcriptional repressor/proline dehydrogenase/delta 1-pyrroline-5-carboxylate dehydrogenase